MKYTLPTFTLPASSNTSQLKWDFAFLSDKEFLSKYKMSKDRVNLYAPVLNEA